MPSKSSLTAQDDSHLYLPAAFQFAARNAIPILTSTNNTSEVHHRRDQGHLLVAMLCHWIYWILDPGDLYHQIEVVA